MKNSATNPPIAAADDDALEACVDAAPVVAGLSIDPAYRDGVKMNLRATANAARLVLEFPLDDEAEPAPVFRA